MHVTHDEVIGVAGLVAAAGLVYGCLRRWAPRREDNNGLQGADNRDSVQALDLASPDGGEAVPADAWRPDQDPGSVGGSDSSPEAAEAVLDEAWPETLHEMNERLHQPDPDDSLVLALMPPQWMRDYYTPEDILRLYLPDFEYWRIRNGWAIDYHAAVELERQAWLRMVRAGEADVWRTIELAAA
jgi:hypothetical protein